MLLSFVSSTGAQQCFVVFDVLMVNDTNLANCPLKERAEKLTKYVSTNPPNLQLTNFCAILRNTVIVWGVYTVEPPLKETPNKGNLSIIMNRITCPKTSLSYSANTFITSEERKPLYNEQNNLSQKLRYSEVPLYMYSTSYICDAT